MAGEEPRAAPVALAAVSAWMTAKTEARSIARRLGLTRGLLKVQAKRQGDAGYEPKVMAFLEDAVKEGDTVWDVGANVGQFARMFSDQVGPQGRVVAFEPVPSCFEALRTRTEQCANVQALNVGLSDSEARLPMHLGDDPEGTIHTFLPTRDDTPGTIELTVYAGDELRQARDLPMPNVLKIDVEGFEPEVLRGLDATLRDPACREVLCEVHFALLESRGQKHAPSEIREFLEQRGFTPKWVTPSHLGARRV
jgi:FkbM family methyltransferase